MGVLDNGCPKNVAGENWIKMYQDAQGNKNLVKEPCIDAFQFGQGEIYKAMYQTTIPITLGSYKTNIQVPVVDCDVPLLISKQTLKAWEVIQNYQTDTIYIGKTKETIKLKNLKSGHYGIKLGTDREDKNDLMKCFMTRNDNLDKQDLISEIKKVHRYLGHPTEDQMKEVYQKQRAYSTKAARNIKIICEECRLCRKYSKTRPGEPDYDTDLEDNDTDLEGLIKKYQELEEHPSLIDSDSESDSDVDLDSTFSDEEVTWDGSDDRWDGIYTEDGRCNDGVFRCESTYDGILKLTDEERNSQMATARKWNEIESRMTHQNDPL